MPCIYQFAHVVAIKPKASVSPAISFFRIRKTGKSNWPFDRCGAIKAAFEAKNLSLSDVECHSDRGSILAGRPIRDRLCGQLWRGLHCLQLLDRWILGFVSAAS